MDRLRVGLTLAGWFGHAAIRRAAMLLNNPAVVGVHARHAQSLEQQVVQVSLPAIHPFISSQCSEFVSQLQGFPKKSHDFKKEKKMPDLLSDDREGKIIAKYRL